ncbi:MurR/RpiR family transcriptional regulator [Aestuariivirga sp.]|uniref:MurR/RpiR family transcriptional regulator n=1 Tax=Aestuariivirga sp. TaxID=2650926 RepID=UPI00391D57D0
MDIREIIAELGRLRAGMSPQVRKAAEFVLRNPALTAMHSMRRVAEEAGVTPPTMLRMVKLLGFDGYEAFRDVYRQGYHLLMSDFGGRARKLQMRRDQDMSLWSDLIEANNAHLQLLIDRVRPEDLHSAAARLLSSRRVFVVGMLSSFSFATYFHYVGRLALPNWHLLSASGSTLADEVATLGPRDTVIAIGFSPYALGTVQVAGLARERKAAVIAITDSASSPLAKSAGHVFVAPNDSPQFFGSFVATIALIEGLLAYIVNQGGEELVKNIAAIEGTREIFDEYWSADKIS